MSGCVLCCVGIKEASSRGWVNPQIPRQTAAADELDSRVNYSATRAKGSRGRVELDTTRHDTGQAKPEPDLIGSKGGGQKAEDKRQRAKGRGQKANGQEEVQLNSR